MTSIISTTNLLSDDSRALYSLATQHLPKIKPLAWIVSLIIGCCALCAGSVAALNFLIGRFSKKPPANQTTEKVQTLARGALPVRLTVKQTSVNTTPLADVSVSIDELKNRILNPFSDAGIREIHLLICLIESRPKEVLEVVETFIKSGDIDPVAIGLDLLVILLKRNPQSEKIRALIDEQINSFQLKPHSYLKLSFIRTLLKYDIPYGERDDALKAAQEVVDDSDSHQIALFILRILAEKEDTNSLRDLPIMETAIHLSRSNPLNSSTMIENVKLFKTLLEKYKNTDSWRGHVTFMHYYIDQYDFLL